MRTVTVLFASEVPDITGVVLLVELPLAGVATTGAAGAVVSTVKLLVLEAAETLPAASVAVAETVCAPAASEDGAVKVQLPEAFAVVVPTFEPSRRTVTVLLTSAVPEIAGDVLLVLLPSAGVATTGATGAEVSTMKVLVLEGTETLPAASVEVTETV